MENFISVKKNLLLFNYLLNVLVWLFFCLDQHKLNSLQHNVYLQLKVYSVYTVFFTLQLQEHVEKTFFPHYNNENL